MLAQTQGPKIRGSAVRLRTSRTLQAKADEVIE